MRMHVWLHACISVVCGLCLIAVVCLSHMLALFLELWEPDTLTSMVISQITCPLGFLFVGFNLYFMFQIRSLYVVQYGLSSDHPDSASWAVRTTVYISSGDSRRSFSRENKTFSQETKTQPSFFLLHQKWKCWTTYSLSQAPSVLEWSCDPFLANEMREGSMEDWGKFLNKDCWRDRRTHWKPHALPVGLETWCGFFVFLFSLKLRLCI